MHIQPDPGRSGFEVADTLESLNANLPASVVLPVHLDGAARPPYDLTRPAGVRAMYSTVLREAKSAEDLTAFLDADTLQREWRDLNLPRYVRRAWETQFPELAK